MRFKLREKNPKKQKSVVHLNSHPHPHPHPHPTTQPISVSLNSREVLGQEGWRNAAHPGATLPNEPADAPYLVATSEAREQRERLNRWAGSRGR